ncbi:MAG TPA: hypothetical protein VFV52_15810 [Bacilli bacterium]|nr:hypothetical protein [Bacilli bacterium]
MQEWIKQAVTCTWVDWSYEETIKAKLLFLDYLGRALARRGEEEAVRLVEHLESFGGAEQATVFAGADLMPAPWAAFGNAMLTASDPLVYPVVLAAVESENKGGQELIAALVAGLETTYRMGDHPHAEYVGALVGVANAYELDEEGWHALLGFVLPQLGMWESKARSHEEGDHGESLPSMVRGLIAQQIVTAGALARDEWGLEAVVPHELPDEWEQALHHTTDKPGMNLFLMATEVNADEMAHAFEDRVEGKVPTPHIRYYVDAVMALEDVCCMPQFFRR